jgi:large repetitive protein
MRGGRALYGDAAVIAALRGTAACDALDVCTRAKRVCLVDEIGKTYADLQAGAGTGIYPAFYCGTPVNKPSCVPYRAFPVNGSTAYSGAITPDDPDGDGVTLGDNCPTVFNPVRPMDGGVQPDADADADGTGDACDPCPHATACPGLR